LTERAAVFVCDETGAVCEQYPERRWGGRWGCGCGVPEVSRVIVVPADEFFSSVNCDLFEPGHRRYGRVIAWIICRSPPWSRSGERHRLVRCRGRCGRIATAANDGEQQWHQGADDKGDPAPEPRRPRPGASHVDGQRNRTERHDENGESKPVHSANPATGERYHGSCTPGRPCVKSDAPRDARAWPLFDARRRSDRLTPARVPSDCTG